MATEMNVLHGLVQTRITNLLAARRLFRRFYGAEWPPRREAIEVELRALLTLARQARRTAQAEPDPIDRYKAMVADDRSYHDIQAAP